MEFTLLKDKKIWFIRIGFLLGIFFLSIFVFQPNDIKPVLLLDNLALEYAPDEWFQSPSKNYSFSPIVDTLISNPHYERFTYSQNGSIFHFNMTTDTSEPYFSENYLTFEYQKDDILCGFGEDTYYFFHYDTMLKVKEISSKGFSSIFEDSYPGQFKFL